MSRLGHEKEELKSAVEDFENFVRELNNMEDKKSAKYYEQLLDVRPKLEKINKLIGNMSEKEFENNLGLVQRSKVAIASLPSIKTDDSMDPKIIKSLKTLGENIKNIVQFIGRRIKQIMPKIELPSFRELAESIRHLSDEVKNGKGSETEMMRTGTWAEMLMGRPGSTVDNQSELGEASEELVDTIEKSEGRFSAVKGVFENISTKCSEFVENVRERVSREDDSHAVKISECVETLKRVVLQSDLDAKQLGVDDALMWLEEQTLPGILKMYEPEVLSEALTQFNELSSQDAEIEERALYEVDEGYFQKAKQKLESAINKELKVTSGEKSTKTIPKEFQDATVKAREAVADSETKEQESDSDLTQSM